MKRLICICIAVILLAASPAMAIDGKGLKSLADVGEEAPIYFSNGYVVGYILGVIETTTYSDLQCVPDGVTKAQTVLVVRKYLKDHPEDLHLDASYLVIKAIQAAWPCKK